MQVVAFCKHVLISFLQTCISFLQTCINFVDQRPKFSHFEGSIIPQRAIPLFFCENISYTLLRLTDIAHLSRFRTTTRQAVNKNIYG